MRGRLRALRGRGDVSAERRRHVVLPALTALILAACGQLETPVGELTGRVVGASAAGTLKPYAYPLGRPDLKVDLVVADADANGVGTGTFTFEGLSTSTPAIVIYDGSDRAELVPVALAGGTVNRLPDRFGAGSTVDELQKMPRAGTLLAAAVPAGGATPWQPVFDLPETVHRGLVPSAGGALAIWPLPPGRFDLGAALPGFLPGRIAAADAVTVLEAATVAAPVPLPIDLDAAAPGCAAVSPAAPSQCENGLVCDAGDGRCYECTATDASNCSREGCNVEAHLCNPPTPSAARHCSPCAADKDCSSGAADGMYCRMVTATSGYCTTRGCASDSDCPSGFECTDDTRVCRPPEGCDAWIQTMGATCWGDDRCHDALEGGFCRGDDDDRPGTCTAACSDPRDCMVGASTSLVCVSGYCAKG